MKNHLKTNTYVISAVLLHGNFRRLLRRKNLVCSCAKKRRAAGGDGARGQYQGESTQDQLTTDHAEYTEKCGVGSAYSACSAVYGPEVHLTPA
jgi:hypothetical protein